MTFSIVGRDPATGRLGVAVATAYWAVGARVPYVRAGLAAIAVQAYAQPYLGYDTLDLMAALGWSGPEALRAVLQRDPGSAWRQVALIDRDGATMGFTGDRTAPWSGHAEGRECVAAGNMLAGAETVSAMIAHFELGTALDLPERLALSLQAGHAAGGDRRGQQSAAVYVVASEPAPYLDLRVDDHPDAIAELVRLVEATRDDPLVRSERFATGRAAPPVEEYEAHHEHLRRTGLAP